MQRRHDQNEAVISRWKVSNADLMLSSYFLDVKTLMLH